MKKLGLTTSTRNLRLLNNGDADDFLRYKPPLIAMFAEILLRYLKCSRPLLMCVTHPSVINSSAFPKIGVEEPHDKGKKHLRIKKEGAAGWQGTKNMISSS
jgi:hypothetical protein